MPRELDIPTPVPAERAMLDALATEAVTRALDEGASHYAFHGWRIDAERVLGQPHGLVWLSIHFNDVLLTHGLAPLPRQRAKGTLS